MERQQQKISDSDVHQMYEGNNVVVLGASGFIGRGLARELCENGANVFLFVRDCLSAEKIFEQYDIKGKIIELDLAKNALSLIDFFQEIKPVITFNLAGYGVDPSERDNDIAYKINADLVGIACKAMAKAKSESWSGQDIIHVGSALEYGEIDGNLSEDSQPNPTTLYGKSKLTGTRLLMQCCQDDKLKGVTVRLFTVYGPGELGGRLLPSLMTAAREGHSVPLTAGLQKRDFTYIDDVVEGLLRVGAAGKPEAEALTHDRIINLASGRLTSVRDFVETAANVLAIETEKLQFGAIPVRNEEMQHLPVSNVLLQRLTHWLPSIGIAEGVRRSMNFLVSLK